MKKKKNKIKLKHSLDSSIKWYTCVSRHKYLRNHRWSVIGNDKIKIWKLRVTFFFKRIDCKILCDFYANRRNEKNRFNRIIFFSNRITRHPDYTQIRFLYGEIMVSVGTWRIEERLHIFRCSPIPESRSFENSSRQEYIIELQAA